VADYQSFVIADLPGIIEGAHEGKGLGLQFLKHIERNAILLFVIPVTDDDPAASYHILLSELEAFNPDLLRKPRMVALSKIDLIPETDLDDWLALHQAGFPPGLPVFPISAVAQKGLDRLRQALWDRLEGGRLQVVGGGL
jgi:GTP-binding protein